MPNNKIIATFILCLGLVVSVWLSNKNLNNEKITIKNDDGGTLMPAIQTKENSDVDWKKILSTVEQKTPFQNLTLDLTETEGATLTDQLSRDFLSQYLLTVRNGEQITEEKAFEIAAKTLSSPEYNQKPVTYIRQNLKVTTKSDSETMKRYKEGVNEAIQPIYYSIYDDPILVFANAVSTENKEELKKLDSVITINKSTIKYLLNMEVPEKAISVHLELLNISSAILFNLENMKIGLDDPIRLFDAFGNYTQNSSIFINILTKMNDFLIRNA